MSIGDRPYNLHLCTKQQLTDWLEKAPDSIKAWVKRHDFTAESGDYLLLPEAENQPDVIAGLGKNITLWSVGSLPFALPEGNYQLSTEGLDKDELFDLALGWHLGSYQFTRYKKPARAAATLLTPKSVDEDRMHAVARAIALTRDLINTPPVDMMPNHLADAAKKVARDYQAECKVIPAGKLKDNGFPGVATVGQASDHPPCLIDLRWGNASHPKVTLVGKGICFDSGGLDIKPSSGMQLMKKDMGGAANVLGLAQLIMAMKLPVRLRVIIPAAENAISGNAFRTSDILTMRNGLTVEVGNTDAEGRLVIADALTAAAEEEPDLLIDFATLTGAARAALGTELPALFSNDDSLAQSIVKTAMSAHDPLWQMPLWEDYERLLKSPIADTSSTGASSYAGAIIAALFLKKFIHDCSKWVHIDLMAWNLTSRPGRPEGGEAMGLRAIYHYLETTYG